MELSDIKTKQALSDQMKDIETAKSMIYRASRELSMVAETLKED